MLRTVIDLTGCPSPGAPADLRFRPAVGRALLGPPGRRGPVARARVFRGEHGFRVTFEVFRDCLGFPLKCSGRIRSSKQQDSASGDPRGVGRCREIHLSEMLALLVASESAAL